MPGAEGRPNPVMAGLDPAIQLFVFVLQETWA
jgi:hypothetical protein